MRHFTITALAALLLSACASGVRIGNMRCEYLESPIAIDIHNPAFTWTYSGKGEFLQAGCELTVSESPDGIRCPGPGENVIYKNVFRTSSQILTPQLDSLRSFRTYFWRITAWNTDSSAVVSSRSFFETAMMSAADWAAKWVSDGMDKDFAPAPMFRKSFVMDGVLCDARLYYSAAAYGEFMLNGHPVSDNVLDPGYTHYDRRNLYTVLDVKDLLAPGDNVISCVLGNGFYNEIEPVAVWNFENARWRDRAKFIAELHLTYADGRVEVISSDSSWKTTSDGPYLSNNIYSGDTYDARKEIPGWRESGFDDSAWQNAIETNAPSDNLKAQLAPPVKAVDRLSPVSRKSFGDSLYVFGFKANISGFCKLAVKGEAGTTVTLTHGELLKEDGRVEMGNIACYHHTRPGYEFQADTYILKGGPEESWTPSFCYHGFQYVEVRTDRPLESIDLVALDIHTDVRPVGEFDCSNSMLRTVWEMARRSYLDNLVSIPTDCPQREKNGWTADAQLVIDLAMLNFDGAGFYHKWMDDFLDNQNGEGRISGIIPTASWGYDDWIGPVWDAAAFIIPDVVYKYTGDLRIISKMYPLYEKYLAYLRTREDADGTVTYGIGDWVYYDTPTPTDYTSSCYYYNDNVLMARFSALLGKDGSAYLAKADSLKDVINRRWLDRDTWLYANGSQTSQAVALYFGLVPDGKDSTVAANLNNLLVSNGFHLNFGSMGSKLVLRMLTRYGYADTAFKVATQKDCPSWGWWIEQGFTTLAETWALSPEWHDASINHVFLGDVAAWYVNDIVGINYDPAEPGFGNVLIKPHFVDGLDWAEASYRSIRGDIRVSWRRHADKVRMKIDIPLNCRAVLSVDEDSVKLGSGHHELTF